MKKLQYVFVVFFLVFFVLANFYYARAATPNIYDFGFEDNTFGSFITGGSDNPTTIGWTFDTDAGLGLKSVKHRIPVNPANQGYAFYYLLSSPRTSLYTRFAYKQSPGFDNSNAIKVLRFLAPGFGTQLGTLMFNANTANLVQVNPDQLQGSPPSGGCSPNTGNPAKRPDATRGEWHWYEFFADISTNNALVYKVWQDDVMIIDCTIARPTGGKVIGTVQVDGTFNAINTLGDVWYDHIGISTQRMGVPTGGGTTQPPTPTPTPTPAPEPTPMPAPTPTPSPHPTTLPTAPPQPVPTVQPVPQPTPTRRPTTQPAEPPSTSPTPAGETMPATRPIILVGIVVLVIFSVFIYRFVGKDKK